MIVVVAYVASIDREGEKEDEKDMIPVKKQGDVE